MILIVLVVLASTDGPSGVLVLTSVLVLLVILAATDGLSGVLVLTSALLVMLELKVDMAATSDVLE